MATTNFVTGMGTFMRAPLPGMTPLHLALSMGNLFIGATSLAFEDSRIREAAVNSLVIGACGIPIGWYYTANAALRSRLQRFVTELTPAAEKAGVKLAMHPADPPLPTLRGTGLLMLVDLAGRLPGVLDAARHEAALQRIDALGGTYGDDGVDARLLGALRRALLD